MRSEPARDAPTFHNEVRAASEIPNGSHGHILHSSKSHHSISETLATVQTPNFKATESAANTIQAAKKNVDIPTPTKQRTICNPSRGFINLKGTIENGDTNGRFIDDETVDGAISGNGTVQNGRARNHSVSETIQNDAITAKAHSRASKKRPGTMASPGGASKHAKLRVRVSRIS